MIPMHTQYLSADPAGLAQAADLLRQGQLVAFPTETVYGLGGDARNGEAVAGIYAAKGRPSFNPLIAHVASVEAAQRYVEWSDQAARLADAFWPGPLTLVLPLRKGNGISSLVTAGLDTLAVRVPAHPTARALLDAVDGPVAAPSANPSGRISPTTADHVRAGLDGRIAAILDDGPCGVGLESTIVGLAGTPTLLRPGGIALDRIEAALGEKLHLHQSTDQLTAPGQLQSHYAPESSVRLNALSRQGDEVLLRGEGLEGREVVIGRTPLLGSGVRVRPLRSEANAGMVELTETQRADLMAQVEASDGMPQDEKARMLVQLEEARVPASLVRRIENRAGG